ncbi:hypothetical protein PROFUN_01519 [Planoprotostelium fungivorum]|uniref:Uncharacterized protein n=1 Tax=Planoprotostelium fungivorum TaxID=1890364 RepID=A0A2P6NTF6_9EUKA|nr:hypothetical protein PROFUN_01519 [Planoprotostelium fungivorum]
MEFLPVQTLGRLYVEFVACRSSIFPAGPVIANCYVGTTPYRLALVGLGRIGAVHFRNINANPRLELRYVIDVNAEKFAALAPTSKYVADFESIANDAELDGVVVCTPTGDHRRIILAALRAKKAVFCEKPISLNLEELDECYAESVKQNTPLLCGYQRRSDPSFFKLKQSCDSGDIGQVQIVKTMSRDNPVPTIAYLKISGGIFHDCGSHDIDLCRWITGEDPVEVFAAASCFNPEIKAIDDFDTIIVTLKFPSGKIGSIDLSRKAAYGYDQRIEVLGDKGMLQANNRQPTSVILFTESGALSDPNCYSFPQRYEHGYAIELDHFADILAGKTQPQLSHDDARKISIIADAAEESARSGKAVQIVYTPSKF